MAFRQFALSDDYWAIDTNGFYVTLYWGKVGQAKQTKTLEFSTLQLSLVEEKKQILARLKQGYQQTHGAKFKENTKLAVPVAAKAEKAAAKPKAKVEKTGHALLDAYLQKLAKSKRAGEVKLSIRPGISAKEYAAFLKKAQQLLRQTKFDFSRGYRELMLACGGIKIETDARTIWIFSPSEVFAQTRKFVAVPKGVTWETDEGEEVPISTAHLLSFAAADEEARWCFDATVADAKGPVFWHHQDEPMLARHAKTGKPIAPKTKPRFKSFDDWLGKNFK